MKILPTFLVIGAAKCGTTSVCDLLGTHPEVFVTDPKEPAYFSKREGFEESRHWYQDLFAGVSDERALGEGSTVYTHPDVIHLAASRIAKTIPDCRLIYMVRDPIARLESDWKMRFQERWTPRSINEAVRKQENLLRHGLYWSNLNVYRNHFSDEQILIGFLEDFSQRPVVELQRMFAHLGVDPAITPKDAGRPRNRSEDRRHRGRLLKSLAHRPWFAAAKRWAPRWLRYPLRHMLTEHRSPPPVEWDPEVRQEVLEKLRPDAERFLEFCGKPEDFWRLQ